MHRLKVTGLALFAVLMFSAVASGMAMAAEPEFTVETASSGSGGAGLLETGGATAFNIESWTLETAPSTKRVGQFHIHFVNVRGPFSTGCTGAGDAVRVLLVLGEYHVRLVTILGIHLYLLWLLVTPVHFTCETLGIKILVVVRGNFLIIMSPGKTKTTHFTLKIKQSKGVQEITEFENEKGEKTKAGGLEASISEGAFEKVGLEAAEAKLTTTKETELIN